MSSSDSETHVEMLNWTSGTDLNEKSLCCIFFGTPCMKLEFATSWHACSSSYAPSSREEQQPTCGDSKVHGDLGARCWRMLQSEADVSARVRALYQTALAPCLCFTRGRAKPENIRSYLDPGHGKVSWLQLSGASWQGQPIASFEPDLLKTLL